MKVQNNDQKRIAERKKGMKDNGQKDDKKEGKDEGREITMRCELSKEEDEGSGQ